MNILQDVISPAEHMAKEIAEVYRDQGEPQALAHMRQTTAHLTFGEQATVHNIAGAMIRGKEWKKS